MLSTELGIWATNTLKEDFTEWSPASNGMGNVRVDMMKLRDADNAVLAASHGRGFFTTTYSIDVYTGDNENLSSQDIFSVFPNPANESVTIRFNSAGQHANVLSISDINGRIVLEKTISTSNGTVSEKVDLSGYSNGVYLVALKADTWLRSIKLVVR
jgi:hypothetical protein